MNDPIFDFERPPATPLVTHDPYFSIWSCADRPTDDETRHWTGELMPLRSVIEVDGRPHRLLGRQPRAARSALMTARQIGPTRTVYQYEQDGLAITLTFLSPMIGGDTVRIARPVTYLTWSVHSLDGQPHAVRLYFEASGRLAVDHRGQAVEGLRAGSGDLEILKLGSVEQPILEKKGDDRRIDWGYFCLGYRADASARGFIGTYWQSSRSFFDREDPGADQDIRDRAVGEIEPVASVVFDLGPVTAKPVERQVLLAYDDIEAVEYFGRPLKSYWTLEAESIEALLEIADREYADLATESRRFDQTLWNRALESGGRDYARICALAYRQCLAAHKIVADADGGLLCFSKENASNGCMGTVDVFYPASPQFLCFNPDLLKAQVTPILEYAASERWPWTYAPHDLGCYPKGNGQVYGGGETSEHRQMPVEECGNMLILLAAIARSDGDASYAAPHWELITGWADYLLDKGFDPENQLCTDDFAGHLAHNTNLSLKAITALSGYGLLCEMRGDRAEAARYREAARNMLASWTEAADDGDHFRLAFDQPGTWSMKYNLVWDQVLDLGLGSEAILKKEIASYRSRQNQYGLPLDSRDTYTKLDWILWIAAMAKSNERATEFIEPVMRYLNDSPDRVPMSDWYWTGTSEIRGFKARSVVGGVYMRYLKKLWTEAPRETEVDLV